MKKFFKIGLYAVLLLIIVICSGLAYISLALPNIKASEDLVVEITPERLARGEYLATHVFVCMDCHSQRDWNYFSGPPKPEYFGAGGEVFDRNMGFPGVFYSRNITPAGIGHWTDGEIYRAITSGVSKDGKALFPLMPYAVYGQADKEDIYAVIAYLRQLKPIKSTIKEREVDFPFNFILNTIPSPANHQTIPDKADKIAYGKYMTQAAGCNMCHTKEYKGKIVGEAYAGGFEFYVPGAGTIRSKNITPHPTAGIGNWTEEVFLERFKAHNINGEYRMKPVAGWAEQSPMPWLMYSGMAEDDMAAIFAYLRTVTPVNEEIVPFSPET
jgi:mono/diheme cytochrome c family protein